MLAHIRNGQLISTAATYEKRKVPLANGDVVHSPPDGWTNGTDAIVPFVEQVDERGMTPGNVDVIRTATTTVEAKRVIRKTVVRDMTQAELDAREQAEKDGAANQLDNQRAILALATALWHMNKGTVPAQALTNPANFKTWFKSLL